MTRSLPAPKQLVRDLRSANLMLRSGKDLAGRADARPPDVDERPMEGSAGKRYPEPSSGQIAASADCRCPSENQ